MRFSLKYKRSAGVPVSAAVHRLISRGNGARNREDWAAAAAAFRQALAADPGLAHIWVQLGHCLKEQGLAAEAEQAYRRAAELQPDKADPLLHLGHLCSQAGDALGAGRYYVRAFQADPNEADAAAGLHRIMARATGRARDTLAGLLQAVLAEDDGEAAAPPEGPAEGRDGGDCLVFDASDLISYYASARLPTGIQRVQIEAIGNALRTRGRAVRVCCFIEGRDDWLEVPAALFRTMTALSVSGGDRTDPEWLRALNRLHLRLALSGPLVFPRGAYLINLGTSWWLQNYFLFVRNAKARYGIRYVPFVHDLIPIMVPEHCTKALTRNFVSWAIGAFAHADHFLVNSHATRRDLLHVAAVMGHQVDPEDIAVIRLDADFRKPGLASLPPAALARWRLHENGFVLLVSTVESRKGHAVAIDAWLELIRRHGPGKVPKLVCVGNNGWLNWDVYRRLKGNEELAGHVVMLSGLSDEELALLYRSCLFTIYPSLYEGWGLPITESLCYGKPVITCDTSSLPEAGGAFADYVEPGSAVQLAACVERMSFDAAYRAERAAGIAAGFRPRRWQEIAGQIEAELHRLAARDPGRTARQPAAMARLGAFHPVTRSMALRVWPGSGSGEVFRVGAGWHWPDADGCWTRPQGGELAIGLPPGHEPLRVGLLLLGAPDHDAAWRVQVRHRPGLVGTLRKGGRKWVAFDHPTDGDVLRLRLRGERTGADEPEADEAPGDDTLVSVGLAGFFIHAAADAAAGMRMLEAIAMGNLDELDAYRDSASRPDAATDAWEDLTPAPAAPSAPPG